MKAAHYTSWVWFGFYYFRILVYPCTTLGLPWSGPLSVTDYLKLFEVTMTSQKDWVFFKSVIRILQAFIPFSLNTWTQKVGYTKSHGPARKKFPESCIMLLIFHTYVLIEFKLTLNFTSYPSIGPTFHFGSISYIYLTYHLKISCRYLSREVA